jgi:hypothetical protein
LPIYVDQSALPVLRLTYAGSYSDTELLQFLSEVDTALKVPGQKVGLIDLTDAKPGSARQRRLQADWIRENEALLVRDVVAAALVTDSAVIRGTVTAVFWIRPLPMPSKIVATLQEAEKWLHSYLEKLPTPE